MMQTKVGELEVAYSSRGNRSYRIELWHPGLSKHRVIKGAESSIVERKARLQAAEWAEKWAAAQAREEKRQHLADKRAYIDAQKAEAHQRTTEANAALEEADAILSSTLGVNDEVDWEDLKDRTPFGVPQPRLELDTSPRPQEPSPSDFAPDLSFLDKLISSRAVKKREASARAFEAATAQWRRLIENREDGERRAKLAHDEALRGWNDRKQRYEADQTSDHIIVDRRREQYLSQDPDSILDYCDLVLSNSNYPDWVPDEWELDYNAETKTIVVEFHLPNLQAIPRTTEVKYVQSRDEFSEKLLPDSKVNQLYDRIVYQITLRTVHELFEADAAEALEAVVFNGIVTSVDPRTGHEATACILSLYARREEFLAVNLERVDPKACFKSLKGVGSSKIHSLTAVAPVLELRREDGRFISAREVANTLDETVNLAAMGWDDFEHLIRELFESEFLSAGGEVRVTQASRDGGVDAVAFDPDPIRGGKIVIQAKRYTNTVGVAAVRDLYGTVLNEGAIKGILVTTSDYGPDAYAFAKDKPLSLLNGANLLHLLAKHGRKASIDIAKAKDLLRAQ